MSLISKRLNAVKISPTLAIAQRAAALKNQGIDIISLSVGESDFNTPEHIKEAAILAIEQNITRYTNVDGILELKQAVQTKLREENNLHYDLDEIIVSIGSKQVIYNILMASLNEGDEVIVPAPYWVSYPDIVKLAGGLPVSIRCGIETDFKLTAKALSGIITEKTKWLIINSPNNPSGIVYTEAELHSLAEVLRMNPHVNVISDDIYEHIVFDTSKFHNLAQIAPDLRERICVVNGVSKAYAMTGWRIGYCAGNKKLIQATHVIQSQSTSNPCSISQVAALAALTGSQDFIKIHSTEFQKRRDLVLSNVCKIDGLECNRPQGAFYLFVKCQKLFGLRTPNEHIIQNSNDFGTYLLEHARVAIMPGIAFGLDEYFRISYAASIEVLQTACDRIVNACKALR